MSWGISMHGQGDLIIDQSFPGHYLDANNPRYLTQYDFQVTSGFQFSTGRFLIIPSSSTGLSLGDGIFYRPPGPLTTVSPHIGYACLENRVSNTGALASCIRTPCHVLHYKSLANHPAGASGWGVVVYTPGGQQSFNSNAHHKRLDVVYEGIATPSSVPSITPPDSITNYYAFISSAMPVSYSGVSWGPGSPTGGSIPTGTMYAYNFTTNSITLTGVFFETYYCIAKVSG